MLGLIVTELRRLRWVVVVNFRLFSLNPYLNQKFGNRICLILLRHKKTHLKAGLFVQIVKC